MFCMASARQKPLFDGKCNVMTLWSWHIVFNNNINHFQLENKMKIYSCWYIISLFVLSRERVELVKISTAHMLTWLMFSFPLKNIEVESDIFALKVKVLTTSKCA